MVWNPLNNARLNPIRTGEVLQVGFIVSASNPVSASMSILELPGTIFPLEVTGAMFYCVSGTATSSLPYGNSPPYLTRFDSFTGLLFNALGAYGTFGVEYIPGAGKLLISLEEPSVSRFYLDIKPGISERIFGMRAGVHSSTIGTGYKYISSSFTPWYVWKSAWSGKASLEETYEPMGYFTDNIADDGTCYSWGKEGPGEVFSEWEYSMEPISHIRTLYASSTFGVLEPYTYEHLISDAGARMPFTVHTSSLSENPRTITGSLNWGNKEALYRFTGAGAYFKPSALEEADSREFWYSVPFQTRVLARTTGSY